MAVKLSLNRKGELLNRFGFKVVERRKEEVEPLLLQAVSGTRPFEIGLYYHDPATHPLLTALSMEKAVS